MQQNLAPRPPRAPPPPAVFVARARLYNNEAAARRVEQTGEGDDGGAGERSWRLHRRRVEGVEA
eukprot:7518145-Alexandrium_andersonii.AAC.1